MMIKDKKINSWIDEFYRILAKNGIDDVLEFLSYPGGIVWITEKQAGLAKDISIETVGYFKKIEEHGDTPGQIDIPLFKIILIKERVLNLDKQGFMYVLAHEISHIFFKAQKNPLEERACDILAECFFGFKKTRGSTLGYLYDAEGFEKVYGKKPPA